MNAKYFAFHPEDGISTYETEEEAKTEAESWLEQYRDEAADDWGWDECAGQICWGAIHAKAKQFETGDVVMVDDKMVKVVDYEFDYSDAYDKREGCDD